MENEALLSERILTLVREKYNKSGSPLLLADLGGFLTEEERNFVKSKWQNLAKYVKSNLADKLEIKPNDKKAAVISAIELDYSNNLSSEQPTASTRVVYPQYYRKLWNLFSGRFPVGKVFILLEQNNLDVIYKSESEENPIGLVQVFEQDFPRSDRNGFLPPRVIAESIRKWAERNNLAMERVIDNNLMAAKAFKVASIVSKTGVIEREDGIQNLLRFLEGLQPSELAQLSLNGSFVLGVLKRSKL